MSIGLDSLTNSGTMPISGGGSSANSSRGNSTINLSKNFPATNGGLSWWAWGLIAAIILGLFFVLWKK